MVAEGRRILVVEDETPLSNALKAKLTNEGFTVTTAGNGEEALAVLKDSQFDLILLDLIMPKQDGWSVLEQLKEQNNSTPVVVTTNLSQTEDKQRAEELGAKDFLVKSNVPISKIVERIQKLL